MTSKPSHSSVVCANSSPLDQLSVWHGRDVIKTGRVIIGETNPLASKPGSIRGDYGIDVGRNVIHGSDCAEGAEREIALWFKPDEIVDWTSSMHSWVYE